MSDMRSYEMTLLDVILYLSTNEISQHEYKEETK